MFNLPKDTCFLDDDISGGLVEHHLIKYIDDLADKLIIFLLSCKGEKKSTNSNLTHRSLMVKELWRWENPNLLNHHPESITNRVPAPPSSYKHQPPAVSTTAPAVHSQVKRGQFTIQKLDESRDDSRFSQQSSTGVIHGNSPNHDHHFQNEVILSRTCWGRRKEGRRKNYLSQEFFIYWQLCIYLRTWFYYSVLCLPKQPQIIKINRFYSEHSKFSLRDSALEAQSSVVQTWF